MKGAIAAFFLVFGVGSMFAQDHGVGLRIGNPISITYKVYLPKDRAVEFGIGTSPPGWNSNYYENSFQHYKRYDNYHYLSHSVNSNIYFQGRYLFQHNIPIDGMVGKLDWYWGIGAVLKFATVHFAYQNKAYPYDIVSDNRTDVDLGPEGIAGMEYTFEDIPLTVLGEVSLMLEFADRPFTFRPFAAVGARFNF
jgi:hypothetical protein